MIISPETLEKIYEIIEPIGFERDEAIEDYLNDSDYYIDESFVWSEKNAYLRLYLDIDEDFKLINLEIVNFNKIRFNDEELNTINDKLLAILV